MTAGKEPVVFIPGVAGSILSAKGMTWPLWPNVLEPDDRLKIVVSYLLKDKGVTVSVAQAIMSEVAGRVDILKLPPQSDPNAPHDIVAPDVIRRITPKTGLPSIDDGTDFYDSFLTILDSAGYAECESVAPPSSGGCEVKQPDPKPDLFVFPYDWRLPVETIARQLNTYIALAFAPITRQPRSIWFHIT